MQQQLQRRRGGKAAHGQFHARTKQVAAHCQVRRPVRRQRAQVLDRRLPRLQGLGEPAKVVGDWVLPPGRRRLLHGVEQLGRRRLPYTESLQRRPRATAKRQEQPRLRRQNRGGLVVTKAGQGVAREGLNRRPRGRHAEGGDGFFRPPFLKRPVTREQP